MIPSPLDSSQKNEAFLNFFQKPLPKEELITALQSMGFRSGEFATFRRFMFAYLNQVHDTYLGDDVVRNAHDRYAHHVWCFMQAAEQLQDSHYIFGDNMELMEYFWGQYEHIVDSEREPCLQYFDDFFRPKHISTAAELESFRCLYHIFRRTKILGRVLVK